MKKVLFNLSGHPTPPGAEELEVISLPSPNVELTPASIQQAALETVKSLPLDVVATGNYEVMLPGLTPLAIALMVVLHGVSGHFPRVRFAVRGEQGFKLHEESWDLMALRLSARELRIL